MSFVRNVLRCVVMSAVMIAATSALATAITLIGTVPAVLIPFAILAATLATAITFGAFVGCLSDMMSFR
jgi:hypothetical protein